MFRQGAGRNIQYESTKAELKLEVQKSIQQQKMANIRYPENPKVNSEAICYLSMLDSYAILFVRFCIDMMVRSEAWDFDRGFNFCL